MRRSLFRSFAPLVVAICLSPAAFADLNQTSVLNNSDTINLDTGVLNVAVKDLQWNGLTLAPQANATAVLLYDDFPEAQFNFITSLQIQLTPGYAKTALTAHVGDLIGVHTNGNHYARILVKAISSGSVTLRITTFGVTQGNGGSGSVPTITSILNNSSRIPDGLPNSGIAPSSIFVIIGSGLADPGTPVLQDSTNGIPLTLNGASISVTVGATTVHPGMYYTSPTQLAGVLPAATPTGNGTLTVTYKGTASNAFPIKVVPAAFGINMYQGNTGVATDAISGALLGYSNSGKPGEILTLWTTGLGADPQDSDTKLTLTPHAVATPLQIYIAGIQADILYQGASIYPGVNQVNVVVPNGVPDGCWISLAAVAAGVLSNVATLPIRSTGGACVDEATHLSTAQLTSGGTGTIRTGFVSVIETRSTRSGVTTINNAANAIFQTYSGVYTPSNSVSPGNCIVNDQTPVSTSNITPLRPGTITLTGPNGLSATLGQQVGLSGAYVSLLSNSAVPATGGTFTFNGTAGADVGAFSTSIVFSNPLFSWTNTAAVAAVNRQQGFTVSWTGGTAGSYVFITGTAAAAGGAVAGFTCMAPVSAGSFQVPGYILLGLPAGNGAVILQNYVYSTLAASGLDIAYAFGDVSISADSVFQ